MANSSAVQLTWDGNTDTDFLGYNVYRSSSNRGPFTKINSSSVPQSSFGDSGLEPGTKYYYKVTKLSGGGMNQPSPL
jgi:fibronectin type 3 domain-containing protein